MNLIRNSDEINKATNFTVNIGQDIILCIFVKFYIYLVQCTCMILHMDIEGF
jgi:hypothetical protein